MSNPNKKFSLMKLMSIEKTAYNALPSAYKNDSKALTFYYDVNNNLIAVDDYQDEYIWEKKKRRWISIG